MAVHDSWPDEGQALRDELRRAPGRLVLLTAGRYSGSTADTIARAWSVDVISVGRLLTSEPAAPANVASVERLLADAEVLTDLDVLFWKPWLPLDPVALLRKLSRRHPVVAVWPGTRHGDVFEYSEPARRDYHRSRINDAIILIPQPQRFPDELPYTVERLPA